MKLIYINDELATADGSNAHAIGMLQAFKKQLGEENVYSFPAEQDGSKVLVNIRKEKLKQNLKELLQYIRFVRKRILSIKKSKEYIKELEEKNFIPTHVIARSTVFDITAVYVAKHFNAKLIYEINTPMYYEWTVIRKAPLRKQIEKWEKKIIEESDYIYVVSTVCRDMLCEHYGVSVDKFVVTPNGYMKDLYSEDENERVKMRKKIRKKEKLEDKFIVSFVGSLKVWHGIQAFCDLAENMKENKKIHFMVIGDGEMRDSIKQYLENHNNMTWTGKLDYESMKTYLYASDLGLMPYNKQNNFYFSPLKMFDMIGASLPFVGTSVAQIKETVDGYFSNDFLFEDNDTVLLCETIDSIINQNEKYQIMKQLVKSKRKNFTWEQRTFDLLKAIR